MIYDTDTPHSALRNLESPVQTAYDLEQTTSRDIPSEFIQKSAREWEPLFTQRFTITLRPHKTPL